MRLRMIVIALQLLGNLVKGLHSLPAANCCLEMVSFSLGSATGNPSINKLLISYPALLPASHHTFSYKKLVIRLSKQTLKSNHSTQNQNKCKLMNRVMVKIVRHANNLPFLTSPPVQSRQLYSIFYQHPHP